MKRYCTTCVILVTCLFSMAQDVSSLTVSQATARLKDATGDSSRIELLTHIVNSLYSTYQFSEAIPYTAEVLQIRRRQGNETKIVRTLDFMGQVCMMNNDFSAARKYWIESLDLKEKIHDTTAEIAMLRNIGLIFFNEGNYTSADQYYLTSIKLSKERNYKEDECLGLLYSGRANEKIGNFEIAKEKYLTASSKYSENGNQNGVAVALNQLSILSNNRGDYSSALKFGFQSLSLSRKINDKTLIVTNLNDITTIFLRNREYDSALNYLFEAREMFTKDKEFLPAVLGNIGVIYIAKGDHAKALPFIQESIKISAVPGMEYNLATRMNNLGSIYTDLKKYTSALESLSQSLQLSKKINEDDLTARNYSSLGKLYLQMSDDSLAAHRPDSLKNIDASAMKKRSIQYLNQSIAICLKFKILNLLQENYRLLADAQHADNNDAEALRSYTAYVMYRDSIYNIDKIREQNKLMLQYTFDRVAAEKDKQLMLSNAAHKARIRLLLLIGAALLLITGLVFYFRRRIEKNKYHLEMASLRQAALNAQMSDHFIGNSMDSINGFIQNNDKAKASDYLTRFSKLIRNVLVNSQEKLVPIEDDLEVLKGYMELESLRFPDGGLTYDIVVDKTIDISQTLIPPMVFQILVENSIKHGFRYTEKGKVTVTIEKKGQMIECKVEDNGRGIDASPNSTSKRISIGGSLAERLVRTAGHNNRNTTYSTINILNSQSKPIGTAVQFSIPYAITD